LFAIQLGNGILRLGVGRHRHKGESARFAGKLILHQQDFGHGAGLCE
jgi:hypothetical protein